MKHVLLMMWLCGAASVSFAEGRQALVTASTRVGLSEKIAGELLLRVETVLTREGLIVKRVAQSCDGERACLVALGKDEARDVVVVVALVMSLKSIVVDLEAASTATGTVLSQTNFKLKGPDAALPDAVVLFARGIAEQLDLEAKARKRLADAPLEPRLAPALPAPELLVPIAPAPSRVPVVISAVAAGAALIAAAVLVGVGAAQQGELPPRDSNKPALSPERAQQLVDGANGAYTGAAIAGGAAGALGLTAIILGVTAR